MPPIEILSIWTISFLQIAVSLLSPTALTALATIQTTRARAVANALNLRNRAQYNAALARSRANLAQLTGDRRLPRDAKDFFPTKGETAEGSKLVQKDKFVFHRYPATNDTQEELPTDDNFLLDERVGESYANQNEQIPLIPGYICTVQDNDYAPVQDDELKISINLGDDVPHQDYIPMVDFSSNPLIDIRSADDTNFERGPRKHCQCHSKLRESTQNDFSRRSEPLCPICGQTLRSGEEENNARQADNFEDFSSVNGELNPEVSGIQENLSTEDNSIPNSMRTQDGKSASPNPHHHLHKHGFVHTHVHQHSLKPIHSISDGTAVSPSTNIINVHQNQQGFVQPAGTYLGPGSTSTFGSHGLHESTSSAAFPTSSHLTHPVHTFGSYNSHGSHASSGGLHINPVIENIHESSGINQHQHGIHLPTSKGINQVQNAVGTGHGNINQNQMAFSGRGSEIVPDLVGESRFSDEHARPDKQDEIVSTFLLPSMHMDSNYPLNSYSARNIDPTKPQDHQPFVKYIEDEQKSINELLHYLERSNHQRLDSVYNHALYNQPSHLPKIQDYHSPSKKEKTHHKSHTPSYPVYGKEKNYPEPSLPTIQEYSIHNDGDQYNDNSYIHSENDHRGYLDTDDNSNNGYDNQSEGEYQEQSEENQDDQSEDEGDNNDYDSNFSYRHRAGSHSAGRSKDSVVGARFGEINLPLLNPNMNKLARAGFPYNQDHLFTPRSPTEFNQETQQKLLTNYLEQEQKNINNAWEEVQKEHQTNFKNLMHSLQQQSEISDLYHEFPLGQPLPGNVDMDPEITDVESPETREAVDMENQDMLTKLLENDPSIQQQIGLEEFEKDPRLGRIFMVPTKQQYEAYGRHTRSLDTAQLNNLLLKEQEIIEELKKFADHNQDLMLLGYIGDSLIDNINEKRNRRKNRMKRQAKETSSLPWKRLITDPNFKMNMQNTLNNLGAATKSAFEYERAPMYHMKNMVGSAKDAVMAAMKIPSQQFIVPTSYQIVPNEEKQEIVTAINPNIYSGNDKDFESTRVPVFPAPENQFDGTFQKVGSIISDNIKSGEETLEHIGDAVNHAKKTLYSMRYVTPRMIMRKVPTVAKNPVKQAILITPKILDFSDDNNEVGSSFRKNDEITVGNIMDAVGLSNPNSNLELEKITMQKKHPILMQTRNSYNEDSNNFNVYDIKVERLGSINEDIVGDTLNSLHEAQLSFGVKSLREFFNKIRENVKSLVSGLRNSKKNPTKTTPEIQDSTIKTEQSKDEIVGVSLIPQGPILHPFMGRVSESQIQEFFRRSHPTTSKKSHQTVNDRDIGPILGAINPIMFERMFNESVKAKNISNVTPHDVFHHDHDGHSHGKHEVNEAEDDDEVSTSMDMKDKLLKPFMGKVSKEKLDKFVEYNSGYEKNYYEPKPEYIDFEEYNSENQEYTPYDDSGTISRE